MNDMRKILKTAVCLSTSLLISTSALAAKVELYALDGRTLEVEEEQVELYTAEGMGWFEEKPVTMYALDGRTLVVEASKVDAHKQVGWYLKEEYEALTNEEDEAYTSVPEEKTEDENTMDKVYVKYTDGTVVLVPVFQLDMYKALGWVEADKPAGEKKTVTMYNQNGESMEVPADEVTDYELAGWSKVKPEGKFVTVYSFDGTEKKILETQVESAKTEGWYPAFDEAVYAYAAFGNGADVEGATTLLENGKYEAAFNMVQNALTKLENTDSEYVSLLYYLRTSITDTWREAANSPLGFINYWFNPNVGEPKVFIEYRNVSNSRIQFYRIAFDVCDAEGNIVDTDNITYYVENIQMAPCENKTAAWEIATDKTLSSIKNLKVKEVVFSDGTKWTAAD